MVLILAYHSIEVYRLFSIYLQFFSQNLPIPQWRTIVCILAICHVLDRLFDNLAGEFKLNTTALICSGAVNFRTEMVKLCGISPQLSLEFASVYVFYIKMFCSSK